jgi:hypothetical protein
MLAYINVVSCHKAVGEEKLTFGACLAECRKFKGINEMSLMPLSMPTQTCTGQVALVALFLAD